VFTVRYGLSPYITDTVLLKGLKLFENTVRLTVTNVDFSDSNKSTNQMHQSLGFIACRLKLSNKAERLMHLVG